MRQGLWLYSLAEDLHAMGVGGVSIGSTDMSMAQALFTRSKTFDRGDLH